MAAATTACAGAGWRHRLDAILEQAGLDPHVQARQWLALACLSAGLAALFALAVTSASGATLLWQAMAAAAAGALLPWLWLRDRLFRRRNDLLRELPGYLDLLTLGLEAGCAFGVALQLTVMRSAPGPLRRAMERALQEIRAGRGRSEALLRVAQRLRVGALNEAVAAIVQAEATGVSLAPVMRAQAVRATQERFARAEKRAMEAPVKMLAPLVLCIFPCTFIVIGFPIAVRLFWGAAP
ncbi:MAG: type II secretion system F family protein [Gammaproteobacteria bacterium]|nr:type II secretion system F family protein [Gammaproteobacteria bacterium]